MTSSSSYTTATPAVWHVMLAQEGDPSDSVKNVVHVGPVRIIRKNLGQYHLNAKRARAMLDPQLAWPSWST